MSSSVSVRPERLQQARRLFFERGEVPEGWVDPPIWRSWQRCRDNGRAVGESVAFNPVGRHAEAHLLERHRVLVEAAEPALDRLARAVAGAGYAVLLTDASSYGLRVHGQLQGRSRPMQLAFRPGVDLSEAAIGTSAMSAAVAERNAVRVYGDEHYFAQNSLFHCVAAPVIDPQGELLGVVDVTRDSPGDPGLALEWVQGCARQVERRLVRSLPASLLLWCDWQEDLTGAAAMLAFCPDGGLLGATPAARRWLGLHDGRRRGFSDLFEGRFADWVDASARAEPPAVLRTRTGMEWVARAERGSSRPLPPARRLAMAKPEVPAEASPMPDFGDPAIGVAIARHARAFRAGLPVLVSGETGTGKEVAARALHALGGRAEGPFVAINCAAIPESLIEAELFGYAEGAFTGARKGGHPGRIRAAHGGTLFLDEIGDMPLLLQARLLRVLEQREVTPVGALDPVQVDIRLVCATHRGLAEQVARGEFRADLWYRIRGVELTLLPLRDRSGLGAWLDALLVAEGGEGLSLSPGARRQLLAWHWPGNVRELRHALRYAVAMAEPGSVWIEEVDLPPLVAHAGTPAAVPRMEAVPATALLTQPTCTLRDLRESSVAEALRACGGNMAEAARRLGVSRATLYRWRRASGA